LEFNYYIELCYWGSFNYLLALYKWHSLRTQTDTLFLYQW
jgi:hypothetical protein